MLSIVKWGRALPIEACVPCIATAMSSTSASADAGVRRRLQLDRDPRPGSLA